MERNGDVLTDFNYCPGRFRLNTNDLLDSKMCKDDVNESLFCDVPKSMKNDVILSTDTVQSGLKTQLVDLLTSKQNFLDSDELMWKNSDSYNFSSSKTMPLISKDSFINGKLVLAASNSSFQIENCFSAKGGNASESSLDTNSDSLQRTFDEGNSSSSIEEIFCPIASDPTEIKSKYVSRVESSQNVYPNKTNQNLSVEPTNFSSPQKETNLCLKERGELLGQKKDRVMPELVPTLICLDDDDDEEAENDDEDSVPSRKESPPAANIAGSPEMPKLIPFSVESDELLRTKAGHLTDSKNTKCPSVDLQSCTRKLFPDAEVVNFEQFKSKHAKHLFSPSKDNVEEVGFSFSASFKSPKQETQKLNCGSDLSQKWTKKLQSKSIAKSKSLDSDIPELLKDSKGDIKSKNSDSIKLTNKIAKKKGGQLNIDKKIDDAEDSVSSLRQPKVLLRRISIDQVSGHGIKNLSSNKKSENITFENCLPSKDSMDNSLTSQPVRDDNSSNEAPEIEEIEGVRFFQFRSKHDMEEFNRKPMVGEDEMELIVPTKTTDITLIKGWRNKYFANDSQLQYVQSDDGNSRDESSQNAKSVPMLAGSNESKFLDFRNCLKGNKTKAFDVKVPVDSSPVVRKNEQLKSETKELKPETKETVKYEKPSNAMSAFVSKDLDSFLKNSATLNIQLLQKVNPNITPIPKGDGILSLGKLRQPDYQLNTLAALKKRNFLNKLKEDKKPQVPAIYSSDSDDAVVVLSSSEESSTEDDAPVASLNSGRKRMATSNSDTKSPINSIKRRKREASLDLTSRRVVLRLTKGNQGPSDNYKVLGVASEKHDSEYSPSSTSSSSGESSTSSSEDSEVEELPDEFKAGADGGLSLIKETIFLKESEPKLLEEFLNNLNVFGTNKDVAMLVQSNESFFGKGPVLQAETCADALDALLINKEFTDLKNKHSPKKKLKAWQKYLPKNLNKVQKQKYTIVPHVSKERADIDKKPPKSETCEKPERVKDEKLISKRKIKFKKFNFQKKITEIEKPKPGDEIVNVKSQVPASEGVPKVRKRRSRSAIDPCDPLLLLERGKRSIRLPARYLDSAVLAVGSEWVSPIFVEEDKKTRKQLLDVLDKITPNKESSEEPKKVNIAKKEELSVPEEQIVKKTVGDNTQPNKAIKRQIKTTNPVKKIKVDEVTECLRIEESNSSKNQSGHIDKKEPKLPEVVTYLMPSCPCWPCSRTLSYKKSTKEFLCFSHNPILEKHNNSKFILESKTSQESTLNESIPADIEIIRSTGPKFLSQTKEKVSSVENEVSGGSEGIQPNKTSSISDSPSIVVDEKMLTSKEVVQDISKKLVFVLPVNKGATNNSLYGKVQPVLRTKEHQISAQKALQLASEMRGKPPILTRKPAPENSSSNSQNIVPTSAPVLSPKIATSTSVVFKLPPVFDNRFVKLAPKPLSQASASSEKQLPNVNAKVVDNQVLSTPQQSSLRSPDPSKPLMKGFKIGNVNFYLEQGHENNSSHPVLKYLANKLSSPSLLSTGISNSSDDSSVSDPKAPPKSEKEDSSTPNKADDSLTPPKVPLDLHNYNKKLERRRKSPLSQRVFNESPESKKILGQLSDSDVDIDTVDEKFNPKLALKKQQLANCSGSDASDIECDEIFSSNIHNVIYNGLKKSIEERKRRLYIKKSFEKLKGTSPFFNDAKSCADILTKSTFAVQQLAKKEVSLRFAKRILRLQNGLLLEKLAGEIKDIKETETRNLLTKRIITVVANDWTKHRKRKNVTPGKPKRKVVKTSQQTDKDVTVSANGTESQIEAPSKQLELAETPKMGLHDSSISFEMASKETEEPVVQLRILELPSSEIDKDILSLLDPQIEVLMEETIPPQTQELDLSQPSGEKKTPVPEVLDGNNSDDDDLLVIDLEGYAAENVTPKKDATVSQDIKAVDSPSAMENFPGLVPIYPSEFYEEDNPFALDLSKFSTITSTSSSPMSIDNAGELQEKSPPSDPDVPPRDILHRATKDVKILHGVGNGPEDGEVKEVVAPKLPPPKVLEEIVIDDSDDESMDTEQNPHYSGYSVRSGTPGTIDNVVIKKESPVKSSSS